jgi:putative PIN family toxin of toxin-antitoxin system
LDSSVLVAAYISRAGACASLLEDVLSDREWVTSRFILDELCRKLREKFNFPADDIAAVRQSVIAAAELVEPTEISAETCRDANDLPVLGTAVAGRADVLITVDRDLLDLERFRDIPILKPGGFWRLLESRAFT